MSEMVLRRIWQTTKRWRWQSLALALFFGFALLSWSGDSIPDRNAAQSFTSRAEVRQRGAVSVRAAVLTDDESQRYFGASLADHGIQAIWLSVDNASESQLEFLPIVTDPEYFSEAEVEQLLHMWWRGSANALVKAAVAEAPMPDIIPQRQAATGFVFTHREGGLKLFGVGFETGSEELLFRFALPVRSGSYAIQQVDFTNIYPPGSINDIDLATLREKLAKLPCCTTNKSGADDGDPLNIVVIGQGLDALFPFIGRGWKLDEPFDLHSAYRTIQAFLFRGEYLNAPVSPLYVFGRQQEVALQKARNTVSLRNHLRLWLAPFTVGGQQVWVGQISRDIGIKLTTQVWYLTTHRISPAVDQDRFYLLQDLIMSGAVSRFGFVKGVGVSSMPNPRVNLGGDPYLTDGLRLVVCLGTPRRAFDQIEFLDWEHPRP
ncbi:LssY C-terminal domain-containing protein [Bradyrhizobium sp.]|uniref:LssY C-terminal domain-containing protein n=1 Tax=Bradyrhizobium sp. TaxID=376 RepID=UPI003C31F72F